MKESRTGKVGHPVRVTISRQDDGIVDAVVVQEVEYAQTIGSVAVPGIKIDYRIRLLSIYL